jgi:hypothetical protein
MATIHRRSTPRIRRGRPYPVKAKDLITGKTIRGFAKAGPLPGLIFVRARGQRVLRIFERRKLALVKLSA